MCVCAHILKFNLDIERNKVPRQRIRATNAETSFSPSNIKLILNPSSLPPEGPARTWHGRREGLGKVGREQMGGQVESRAGVSAGDPSAASGRAGGSCGGRGCAAGDGGCFNLQLFSRFFSSLQLLWIRKKKE